MISAKSFKYDDEVDDYEQDDDSWIKMIMNRITRIMAIGIRMIRIRINRIRIIYFF